MELLKTYGEFGLFRTSPNRFSVYHMPSEQNIGSNMSYNHAIEVIMKELREARTVESFGVTPTIHGRLPVRQIYGSGEYERTRIGRSRLPEMEREWREIDDIVFGRERSWR